MYGLTRNVWGYVGLTLNGAGEKQVVRKGILPLLPFDHTIQHVSSALFISLLINGDDKNKFVVAFPINRMKTVPSLVSILDPAVVGQLGPS